MQASARYPSLQGRTVFISGGATGIGASFVEQFAAQGAKVGFVDRDAVAGQALVDRIAARPNPLAAPVPLFVACDVTDTDALRAAIGRTRAAFGPIGALINNAANDQRHQVEEVTPAFWDQCMAVNLRHQFFAAQAVVEDMVALGGARHPLCQAQRVIGVLIVRRAKARDWRAQHAPDTRLFDGLCDGLHEIVHVCEGRRAGPDQLDTAEHGAFVYEVGREPLLHG
jgi:NAD(P)-dependent dehydrogenase (short-subunit alcohol dehydrogenase family)